MRALDSFTVSTLDPLHPVKMKKEIDYSKDSSAGGLILPSAGVAGRSLAWLSARLHWADFPGEKSLRPARGGVLMVESEGLAGLEEIDLAEEMLKYLVDMSGKG